MAESRVVVIGLGNALRSDDGAGVMVARRIRDLGPPAGIEVREHQGEAMELLGAWRANDVVVLVDTMRSGADAGTIRRFDATTEPLPTGLRGSSSTHVHGCGGA